MDEALVSIARKRGIRHDDSVRPVLDEAAPR
jgi:hypothetical protein